MTTNKTGVGTDFDSELYNDIFKDNIFLYDALNKQEDKENHMHEFLEKYVDYKENKKIFTVYASRADEVGNVYCALDGNITGIIPNVEIEGKEYNSYHRAKKMNKHYSVIVTDVDKETGLVTLSYDQAKKIAKNIMKNKLLNSLQKNEKVKLKARIMFVSYNKRINIDIGGVGLFGYIPVDEWKHGFEYDIKESAKPGMIIDIEILKYKKPIEGKKEAFICSRKNMLPDPWKGIEQKVPKSSTLIITCTDKKENKFFGKSEGIDIDIYCEYPDAERKIVINKGLKYKGYVYAVSEERKLLKARIFDVVK